MCYIYIFIYIKRSLKYMEAHSLRVIGNIVGNGIGDCQFKS